MANSSSDKSFSEQCIYEFWQNRFEESGFFRFAQYSIIHVRLSVLQMMSYVSYSSPVAHLGMTHWGKQIQFSTCIKLLFNNWQRLRKRVQSRSGLVGHQRSHNHPHRLVTVLCCVTDIELMEVDTLIPPPWNLECRFGKNAYPGKMPKITRRTV